MEKIAVIPNSTKDIGLSVTRRLVEYLSPRAQVHMEKQYEGTGFPARFCGPELFDLVDCVIVLGGDGTILKVAEPCGRRAIPVMGVNLGKVGFMAEIEMADMEAACDRLLAGDYAVEKRMMMRVVIRKDGRDAVVCHALNDVVVAKMEAQLIALSIFSDGVRINAYTADGVIIATPTGSTGYSLSAGGPVADPTMELFIASPICAHMLNARPALMHAEHPVTLRLSETGAESASVTVDGEIQARIGLEDEVLISKSGYTVPLVKLGTQSFYDTLIQKLT